MRLDDKIERWLTQTVLGIVLLIILLVLAPLVSAACPDPLPVDTVCLGWEAPEQNVDGSDLTDLAGFEVFWGMTSGDFVQARKLDIPDQSQVELTTPAGTIKIPSPGPGGGTVTVFFVMTAYDSGVIRDSTINCIGDPTDDDNDPGNPVNCRGVSVFSNEIGKAVTFADQLPEEPRLLNVIINVTS